MSDRVGLLDNISKNSRRLIGWKAIGHYLGCSARTAARWESERALPIHRLPGGRGSVWATPDELAAWLRSFPAEVQAAIRAEVASGEQKEPNHSGEDQAGARTLEQPALFPPVPTSEPKAVQVEADRPWSRVLVAIVSIAVTGIVGMAVWAALRADARAPLVTHTPYDDDLRARDVYLTARLEFSTRTADSLHAAEKKFQKLVQEYPDRAAGWAGLADVNVLLPEFAADPGDVTYPKAERAARIAIALDPKLADAWLDKAFVAWWWRGDAASAFPAFETALKLDPNSARGYHWYATALVSRGEFQKALGAVARARALDPGDRAIVADEAEIRFDSGQRTEALATLEEMAKIDPRFVSWHLYLARFYLITGRDADYLREAITAAELQGLPNVVAGLRLAEERLHTGGRHAMLDQLSSSETRGDRGAGNAVRVAWYRAIAGDRTGMLHWLSVALAQHDPDLVRVESSPAFEAFRNDPDFQKVVNQAIEEAARNATPQSDGSLQPSSRARRL